MRFMFSFHFTAWTDFFFPVDPLSFLCFLMYCHSSSKVVLLFLIFGGEGVVVSIFI